MSEAESNPAIQEVLTQSEVEQLLAQVTEQQSGTVIHKADGAKKKESNEAVQPYDFRNPVYLTAGELRRLRIQHEEYIRSLAARLSIHLRVEFSVQMSRLQTLNFQKFTEGLSNPTHLTLFKVPPLVGTCILEVSPRLGLTIVDRLLGGPGHSVNLHRDLSEIEVALLDQAIEIVINEWCRHWSGFMKLQAARIGHETNGHFLRTSAHDAVVLVLSMEVRMGDCIESMQLAFPYPTIEPLIQHLAENLDEEDDEAGKARRALPTLSPRMAEVPLSFSAQWPALQMVARDLAGLKVGDVVPIPSELAARVQLRLADVPLFQGRLGTQGNHWAVEITRVRKPQS